MYSLKRRAISKPWRLLLATLGALILPAAAAQADAVWTGASSSAYWSAAANWTGSTPTSNTAAGTLSFPSLGTCTTCYTSNNDLSGVSARGLILGNTSSQYSITGNRFTVRRGGISDTAGGGAGDVISAPLALSGAAQAWVVGSQVNGYNSLTLLGGITGAATPVVSMSMPEGDLFVDSDMEVGPVTSNGPGGLHIGGAPGTNRPGSINASDGEPVTVSGGTLVANPGSTTGPLSITGTSTLLLGTNPNNNGATTLGVQGAATLASSITTMSFIDDNGSSAGTDFSQLSASGNITLGGKLVLGQGLSNNDNTGPCATLSPGDVATLVATTGTLTGTFSNALNGATLTMGSSCQSTPPTLQITYTSDSVIATVLGTATSTSPPTSTQRPPVSHRAAAPVLSHVSQSHVRWREPHTRAISRARHGVVVPVGTRFSFRVNARVRVTLTFVQVLPGRRVGRRCVAATRARSRLRACRRTRLRGRLVRAVSAGTHHVRFAGRVGRTRLPAGHYSLTVTVAERDGARSRRRTLHFTIVGTRRSIRSPR